MTRLSSTIQRPFKELFKTVAAGRQEALEGVRLAKQIAAQAANHIPPGQKFAAGYLGVLNTPTAKAFHVQTSARPLPPGVPVSLSNDSQS